MALYRRVYTSLTLVKKIFMSSLACVDLNSVFRVSKEKVDCEFNEQSNECEIKR